ncbi:hypothetical protein CYLTODRAFT_327283, partial [Cylindrobasidium torrendii FP15055 ss-10]
QYEDRRREVPLVHIEMGNELLERFREGYNSDPQFTRVLEWTRSKEWSHDYRFFRNEAGLLFFKDADYVPRLCVPRSLRAEILIQAHEHPLESAH